MSGMLGSRDANGTSRLFPQRGQGLELRLNLLKMGAQAHKQSLPRLRWGDAARGACQQPKTQLLLEPARKPSSSL
jgi:hypothetical protein